jgi:hypothetical protein
VILRITLFAALCAGFAGCDRNLGPFVPGEEPRSPDLAKIFPEGSERTAPLGMEVELPAPPGSEGRGADPSAGAPPIRGVVRIDETLAESVPRDAVLFLIARVGPTGPPLAVRRFGAPRFPLEFDLGPEHRMIKTLPFAGELRLTARLDRDGDAGSRTAGDLQGGAAGTFAPGATGVVVVLDEAL